VSPERHLALLACGLCLGPAAMAEEELPPEAEFLEYLGMWEETDEDWLLLNDITRSDPVPEGEESTETENES
jgi:hypothetical protein